MNSWKLCPSVRSLCGMAALCMAFATFTLALEAQTDFPQYDHVFLVIMENEGKKLGLLVDELLGQAQVVIKNLETNYRKVEGVIGATIMGDGRVALILDALGLTRLAALGRGAPVTLQYEEDNRDLERATQRMDNEMFSA